jgi:M6 family metalloprotease-like protein
MKSKTVLVCTGIFVALSLASCGNNSTSNASVADSESISDYVDSVKVTLNGSSINIGGTLAGMGYSVIVHHTVKGDYDMKGSTNVVMTITGPDKKTYADTDPLLVAGTYTIVAVYKGTITTDPVTFSVSAGTLDTAEHFAKTVTNFDGKDAYTLAKNNDDHVLKSTGTQKLLVIPIDFTDDTYTSDQTDRIKNAFFGDPDATTPEVSWESLESFYKKASYGKLDLQGTVAPVYHSPLSSTEAAALTKDSMTDAAAKAEYGDYWNLGWYMADKAVEYVKTQGINTKDYDLDNDGFIDGLWMVYNHPYAKTKESSGTWWAFTHRDYANHDHASTTAPTPYDFCWASYDFLENYTDSARTASPYYTAPNTDAHTLVHETGHLMGLNDYYDTDGATSPTGGMAMQDLNIGDQDPYSKMALNWITPRVIDNTSSYFQAKLEPFEKNGDCLLVHTSSTAKTPTASNTDCSEANMTEAWNKTPFDEYLLIAYYTPTGLNASDSNGYAEWMSNPATYGTGSTWKKPGIMVWHVDARLIKVSPDKSGSGTAGQTWIEYTDDFYPSTAKYSTDGKNLLSGSYITMLQSNTKSKTTSMTPDSAKNGGDFRELTLVTGDADATYLKKAYGKRVGDYKTNLFTPDNYYGFSKEKFTDYFKGSGTVASNTFNDGTALDYNFVVTAQDDASATMIFAKNS